MITIRVSGSDAEAVKKMASKWKTTIELDRKVVRSYEAAHAPNPLPTDADVIIITETENHS